jgi:tRNA (guanine-N7-)-methyltransferase
MTQRVLPITSPRFIAEPELARYPDLAEAFAVPRPLALEIGCGIGDFMVQLAPLRPEVNFLAIDIYNKGCLKTCKKLDAAGLQNVRVARAEARFLLTHHVRRESLAAIYINCPDPWPKKRHRERRLVGRDFLRMVLHYLRPGGELFFCTDFADYAAQVAALHPTLPGFANCLPAPFAHDLPGYPVSKYMRRFLSQGQPIHYFHLRKRADFRADEALLPPVERGFRARWPRAENG